MSNGNSPPNVSNGPKPVPQTLIQAAFPDQPTVVFASAIVVGVLFILMTTVFQSYFALNGMQSNLILCIGSALVLAAFGGQATVRVGGIIMAGAAAVALGLFISLQRSSEALVVQGTIHNFDFDTYKSLVMSQKHPVLGRIVQNDDNVKRSRYEFAIFKKDLDSPMLEIALTRKDQAERVLQVDTRGFEWAFGRKERLEWQLREEGTDHILSLFDLSKRTTIAREISVGTAEVKGVLNRITLVSTAFAQERGIDVPLMLTRLKADDATTRRSARMALSQASIDSIRPIVDALHGESSNYQVKLGICVALTEMLRADKSRAASISSRLTERDLNKILDAAGDADRTVRVYASEFLYDLGDPRTTKLAISRAAATSDENARYNWLLVSQDGWRKLSLAEKTSLSRSLNKAKERSGQKTLKLIEKLQ